MPECKQTASAVVVVATLLEVRVELWLTQISSILMEFAECPEKPPQSVANGFGASGRSHQVQGAPVYQQPFGPPGSAAEPNAGRANITCRKCNRVGHYGMFHYETLIFLTAGTEMLQKLVNACQIGDPTLERRISGGHFRFSEDC